MVVALSESQVQDGYVRATVIRSDSWQQPVPAVDVPPGREILLSSVGGDGEDGHGGGDGQTGLPGSEGLNATPEAEATVNKLRATFLAQ